MIQNGFSDLLSKSTTAAVVFLRKWFSVKSNRIIAIPFCAAVLFFLLIPLPRFPVDYSAVVLDANGEILHVFLNKNQQWCMPPDPSFKIPGKLQAAVLEYEDRWFRWHPGVNPAAAVRALAQNAKSGDVRSGASTITMQVARLARSKARTLPNKILEMLQALKLEALHSKKWILQSYLDHAPYGRNVVGVRAASLRYYGKTPERLSWAEAATLAVLPNGPGLIAPGVRTDLLKKKRDRLLLRLVHEKLIDEDTYALSLIEPIPAESRPFAGLAPHLARRLHSSAGDGRFIFATTIRKDIQARVESLVAAHSQRMRELGIRNAAALVVETATGKVRAYVGSQDFFDFRGQGQVDGLTAPRSPGSLLKPFLYAMAMDQGILLPQTRVKDVPTYYGAFSPANASQKYDGLVTVKDALIRSLNVPAVRILHTMGVDPFHHFLKAAGVKTLFRSAEEYGLPLVLGGAEVTAWDMAVLFRGLGNGGRFLPLNILEDSADRDDSSGASPLISPGASYLTLTMLKELKRPEAEIYWDRYQNQWPIAWKTGTSYGQRDAWAAGVSPQWTLVVWVGNFDGEENANISGAPCAGTLLFTIYNSLPKNNRDGWFSAPVHDLDAARLCLESGYLAGPLCEKTQTVEAPRYMKPLRLCPYHQKLFLSEDGRFQVCSACWEVGKVRETVRLVFPADVVQYLRESGKPVADLPGHKPTCTAQKAEDALEILYPTDDARLWIPRDLDGRLEKVTFRAAHREKEMLLYWYLDDVFVGTSRNRHAKSLLLTFGAHTLEIIDENGNRARVNFQAGLKGEKPDSGHGG
jgi:penicillin-binding protein 1C